MTDWSDTETIGLKRSIGQDSAMQLLKGCKVQWISSWHCVCDRVVHSIQRKVSIQQKIIATAIMHVMALVHRNTLKYCAHNHLQKLYLML